MDIRIQDAFIELQQHVPPPTPRAPEGAAKVQNSNAVQLPKIKIPSFDGEYLKWTSFRDLYVQVVHTQAISNTQKMFYLSTNLTGEAKALIKHLPLTDDNYDAAWAILENRYNNKRLLVTSLLNKLFGQPALTQESAAAIRSLHDISNEALFGLRNLSLPVESWDAVLVHLLLNILERSLQRTNC